MSNSSAGLVCPKCHSADYRKLSKPLVGRFEGPLGSPANPECYCGWCGREGRSADLVVDPKYVPAVAPKYVSAAPTGRLIRDSFSVESLSGEFYPISCSGVYFGPGCSG